jgi:hypothetical protein
MRPGSPWMRQPWRMAGRLRTPAWAASYARLSRVVRHGTPRHAPGYAPSFVHVVPCPAPREHSPAPRTAMPCASSRHEDGRGAPRQAHFTARACARREVSTGPLGGAVRQGAHRGCSRWRSQCANPAHSLRRCLLLLGQSAASLDAAACVDYALGKNSCALTLRPPFAVFGPTRRWQIVRAPQMPAVS